MELRFRARTAFLAAWTGAVALDALARGTAPSGRIALALAGYLHVAATAPPANHEE
ncbi:MAG TPA: hypothetical protein VF533_04370 [Solirubrobacteraceae bacterium]|jgi:hypothetical protein